ncbi:MAG: tetratricopeptide repeat protein [Burkholderiaceae bacterium]|nr:tetratricopeptide repeat protein [Burkholderiaceae bacterium]
MPGSISASCARSWASTKARAKRSSARSRSIRSSTAPRYGKGLSLVKLDRVEDAVAALKKVIELQPMSPYGYYQLAHVYHRLGDTERIVATIRRLSKFEPKVALQLERETGVDAGIEDPFRPGERAARKGS